VICFLDIVIIVIYRSDYSAFSLQQLNSTPFFQRSRDQSPTPYLLETCIITTIMYVMEKKGFFDAISNLGFSFLSTTSILSFSSSNWAWSNLEVHSNKGSLQPNWALLHAVVPRLAILIAYCWRSLSACRYFYRSPTLGCPKVEDCWEQIAEFGTWR